MNSERLSKAHLFYCDHFSTAWLLHSHFRVVLSDIVHTAGQSEHKEKEKASECSPSAVLEMVGAQNWVPSHWSAKFICNLLKLTEGMYVCEEVSVLLQMLVIKVKGHLGPCSLKSNSDNLFVPLTFDELGF